MTLAGVLPAGQYPVVTHVGPFGQLAEAVRNPLNWVAERGLAWDKSRAFFGLISEAVRWVTIVDGTLVRHHLEAYDGVLGNRPSKEHQLVEGTLAGPGLFHHPAADCLLTCDSSKRGSVRPDQKEMLRAVRLQRAPEAMLSLVAGTAVPSGLKPSVSVHQRDKNFPYVVPA